MNRQAKEARDARDAATRDDIRATLDRCAEQSACAFVGAWPNPLHDLTRGCDCAHGTCEGCVRR